MAIAPLFFRRAVGAFLVYDVSSMESFQALDKWYEQILKNTDTKVIVMLLGNKRDKNIREVPYNVAMQYAIERNFGLVEVSAKTGFGINEAFSRLVSEVYKFQTLELAIEENIRNPNLKKGQGMVVPAASVTTIGSSAGGKNSITLQPERHKPVETEDDSMIVDDKKNSKDCKC